MSFSPTEKGMVSSPSASAAPENATSSPRIVVSLFTMLRCVEYRNAFRRFQRKSPCVSLRWLDSMGAGLFKLPSTRRWGDTSSLRFLSRRLHCEPMRQRLQWTWMVALAILFTHRPVRAESPANSPSMPVQQSDACARRLHEIYDEAARLEEKTPPEQAALADCVRSRALKIKGLLALMEETQKDIRQAVQAA